MLADDKERERKKEKKEEKARPEKVDQEAICEEIVAACQNSDCSRLMYGMLTNGFRYVITRAVAHNEIYAAVSRNYFLSAVESIFYFVEIILTWLSLIKISELRYMKFRIKKLIFQN